MLHNIYCIDALSGTKDNFIDYTKQKTMYNIARMAGAAWGNGIIKRASTFTGDKKLQCWFNANLSLVNKDISVKLYRIIEADKEKLTIYSVLPEVALAIYLGYSPYCSVSCERARAYRINSDIEVKAEIA